MRPSARRTTAKACRKTLAHKAKMASASKATAKAAAAHIAHQANGGAVAAKHTVSHKPPTAKAAAAAHIAHQANTVGAGGTRTKIVKVKATGLKGKRVAKATTMKSGC